MSTDNEIAIVTKALNLRERMVQATLALVYASRDKQVTAPPQISAEFDALCVVVDEYNGYNFETRLNEEQRKNYPPDPPKGYVYGKTMVGETQHLMQDTSTSGKGRSLCKRYNVWQDHLPERHTRVCSDCAKALQDLEFQSQLDEYYANLPD